ncbi:MAG: hypothetical protein IRZ24_16285 [Thermogemmatispora sp.]|uniref:hypothetical protein n=1 Tax=Thermogemmatispora sp. TaxID=1968838 RepID=UPI001E192969|nr:hypothetical protein [Thermogemmatispora sp.]MBX5451621.1 hypothetical protein [Thermogemmatispora sp.]
MAQLLEKVARAYHFFLQAEQEGRIIQDSEIQAATGYTQGTTRTYIQKKWWWFLSLCPGGGYRVQGLRPYSFDEFLDLHRQKRAPFEKHSPHARPGEKLVIFFPQHLAAWLHSCALRQRRSVQELVIELIERAFKSGEAD